SAAPVTAPSNSPRPPRTPGVPSSAATTCISEVPGFAKQVVSPLCSSVASRESVPFTGAPLSRPAGPTSGGRENRAAVHACRRCVAIVAHEQAEAGAVSARQDAAPRSPGPWIVRETAGACGMCDHERVIPLFSDPVLDVARETALIATARMLAWADRLTAEAVDAKDGGNDLVTAADSEIEALVRHHLAARRPGDTM